VIKKTFALQQQQPPQPHQAALRSARAVASTQTAALSVSRRIGAVSVGSSTEHTRSRGRKRRKTKIERTKDELQKLEKSDNSNCLLVGLHAVAPTIASFCRWITDDRALQTLQQLR